MSRRQHCPIPAMALACLVTCLLLPACVPLPMVPHHLSGLRSNVGGSLTVALVPGQTTRDDVVLAFGELDGSAIDDTQNGLDFRPYRRRSHVGELRHWTVSGD